MAGGEEVDDELALEHLLELQTKEHKESLAAVEEALASDPSNAELLSVHGELISAIKDAEEGLLHLKRSRLLREADEVAAKPSRQSKAEEDAVVVESADGKQEEEPGPSNLGGFSIGSRCRFRHTDGRWYEGRVVGFEDTAFARVSFLTPTSESMLMCKFFLQQRCRFGNNCRMSHGLSMPVSSLKEYTPTMWQESFAGNCVWVGDPCDSYAIWKEAELEAWDDRLKLAHVVFQDGSSAKVGSESLALSEYAQMTDEDEYSTSEYSGSDEEKYSDNESGNPGIGSLDGSFRRGVQTETALFATWESHTRGIASKMMANMGYREGMGLGASGQGIVNPIPVKILKAKQSLDLAVQSSKTDESERNGEKKRSRGGKRKRDKKYAEAARALKAEQEPESDVFRFINEQLAGQLGNKNDSGHKQRSEPQEARRKEDRRSLVEYGDKIKELRVHVGRLEEMANRNRNDKVVYEAALRKLKSARKELVDAEEVHASASNAVVSKEKEKKWLKF